MIPKNPYFPPNVKAREHIPEDKYDLYFKHFNPDMLDAREWARAAKAAGMKYAG